MIPLFNFSFLTEEAEKISRILNLNNLFLLVKEGADAVNFSPRKGDRRKNPRREIDKYKKASHKPYRYVLCAQNRYGVRNSKSAYLNVIIVHGLRGYEGLYETYAEYHTIKGRNAIILDFPGHGKNPGDPCRIHHTRYFETCVESAIVEAYRLNPKVPTVLITFSMGGLVTLQYLFDSAPMHIKRHIAGVACLGVPLEVGTKDVPSWKLFLAPILAWMFPWWEIQELCIDKNNISHDADTVKEVCEDPMIYKGPLRAWTAYSILRMAKNVFSRLRDGGHETLNGGHETFFRIPLYFARGELDKTAERAPYDEGGIPVKDYPKFKHELLKGAGSEVVREDIDTWIENIVLPEWREAHRAKN